jgi:hypothetical protein
MLQTGFTTAQDYSQDSLQDFIRHVRLFKKTRCIGSAALALAWTAVGRSDVYHEPASACGTSRRASPSSRPQAAHPPAGDAQSQVRLRRLGWRRGILPKLEVRM